MFFSGVNFLCSLIQSPFHTHFTAVACKRSQPFCLKCRWQVTLKMHAYTLDPTKSRLADCCPGIVMEPIRQTSSLTGHKGRLCHSHLSSLSPLQTDPGLKVWNGCVPADLHLKKKKCRWGFIYQKSSTRVLICEEKVTSTEAPNLHQEILSCLICHCHQHHAFSLFLSPVLSLFYFLN